uniref:Uncharacterized protein n=1 Tax=Chrysocystis fragilis TaxID=1411660 RepID=A0A7S0XLV4_9STRA|mmetsp:Transcript_1016/g.2985  ORF Transcript_1016/g.2985 Transcript_1016/m.2985 type:complete len:429 (+) Transcript_1016:167-1453(+)
MRRGESSKKAKQIDSSSTDPKNMGSADIPTSPRDSVQRVGHRLKPGFLANPFVSDRKLTSYQIFQKFIKFNDTKTEVNCKGVLSRECFEMWKKSRSPQLQKPEESFQTALLGHVSGTDRRKAFTPLVEKALLHELRKKQVWPCFQGTHKTIGIKGTKKIGYHEKREMEAGLNASVIKTEEATSPQIRIKTEAISQDFVKRKRRKIVAVKSETQSIRQEFPPPSHNVFSADDIAILSALKFESENLSMPAGKFANSILQFYGDDASVMSFFRALRESGFYKFSDASLFLMLNLLSPSPILESSFMFPQGASFKSSRSVAVAHTDRNFIIQSSSPAFKQLFGESGVAKSVFNFSGAILQTAVSLQEGLIQLLQFGRLWIRQIGRTKSGTRSIILIHVSVVRADLLEIQVQDVSDDFPSILDAHEENLYFD